MLSDTAELLAAKRRLGIDRLLLQIHDASFPCDPGEEFGRGSPYSYGAERFFAFAARLGFDGIQLGPQGMTGRGQMSPYEATLFSRNPLNLPLGRLAAQGRISSELLESGRERLSTVASPSLAWVEDFFSRVIQEILQRADDTDRECARSFLAVHREWLIPDALYAALCRDYQAAWWGDWHSRSPQGEFDQRLFAPRTGEEARARTRLDELRQRFATQIEDYALVQWLLAEEHRRLRKRLSTLGLTLFADLQVGLAPQDIWSQRAIFLPHYRLGAPPSRTNPDGQPWGFPVLDPLQYGTPSEPGPVLRFVQARLDRVLSECDGLRIDHPHGWIDPWVYRLDDPDPTHAVQQGARLFSSPAERNHPELADWAIARSEQIDSLQDGYGDARVHALEDAQVTRYARLLEMILQRLEAHERPRTAVACEVLSTMPYPIRRVLERFGLGRFRVTSKLKLDDPVDAYRIEQAAPEDWIMLGTHDTATIWHYAADWFQSGSVPEWARYLATFLAPEPERAPLVSQISGSPGEMVHALFAAMLASPARNVSVFFPDVFGMTERYNRPGTVSDENWRLRLPPDFERLYESRRQTGTALDLARCLAMAISGTTG